jgi:GcrA cell cycle regulator
MSRASIERAGSWSIEELDRLKAMWAIRASAGEIAAALTAMGQVRTRNAVLGMAHRLGLPGRPSPIRGPAGPRPAQPPRKPPRPPAAPAAPRPKDPAPRPPVPAPAEARAVYRPVAPVSPHRTCQWPMNDAAPWEFCGKPRDPTRRLPYCTEHAVRAIAPPRERREDAA